MPAAQAPLWSGHRRACPIAATKGHGPGLGVKTPGKPGGIVPLHCEAGAGRGWSSHRRACPSAATKGHGSGLGVQTPGKPGGIVRLHYEAGRRRCGAGRSWRRSARGHPRAEIDRGRKQCRTDEDRARSSHFTALPLVALQAWMRCVFHIQLWWQAYFAGRCIPESRPFWDLPHGS